MKLNKKFSSVWAIGQILVAIFIVNLSWKSTGTLMKLIGIIGGVIWITSQSLFLLNKLK